MTNGDDLLRRWVDAYVAAWDSNDPDEIAALFTDGAAYYTEPSSAPWVGRDEIVRPGSTGRMHRTTTRSATK
jgi:uncharacterized protein (TIGR02246 family)